MRQTLHQILGQVRAIFWMAKLPLEGAALMKEFCIIKPFLGVMQLSQAQVVFAAL